MMTDKQYIPFFLEYTLMGEYQLLKTQNLNGIYVMPSARTPLVWFGIIFVRQGLYQGGVFRFCVIIPPNYPNGDCPQLIFDQAPYHPLVDSRTGQLDVKRGFPKWKRDVHRIYNVLAFARRIFFKIDTEGALNTEAATLYRSKLLSFKAEVVKSIENSKKHLNDAPKTNDPYELVFNLKESGTQHEKRKEAMLQDSLNRRMTESDNMKYMGLSWVNRGSISPFSKS